MPRLTTHPRPQVLEPLLAADDVVINLSVDVSSVALIALCAERGALYLDTVRPHVRSFRPRMLGRDACICVAPRCMHAA